MRTIDKYNRFADIRGKSSYPHCGECGQIGSQFNNEAGEWLEEFFPLQKNFYLEDLLVSKNM